MTRSCISLFCFRLSARLCGLIFLIRKLPRTAGADSGVRATPEMLADLLVSDLANDGTKLRKDVPVALLESNASLAGEVAAALAQRANR